MNRLLTLAGLLMVTVNAATLVIYTSSFAVGNWLGVQLFVSLQVPPLKLFQTKVAADSWKLPATNIAKASGLSRRVKARAGAWGFILGWL